MKYIFQYFLFFFLFEIEAQNFTLEDIWTKNTFQMNTFDGYKWAKKSGTIYKIDQKQLVLWDILKDKKIASICNTENWKYNNKTIDYQSFEFSNDESKIILEAESEQIYRRSSKAIFYIYDVKENAVEPVADSLKLSTCELSPDAKKIAYTFNNNLYIKDLITKKTTQITTDGKPNFIINGTSDWVYEEEFEIVKCFDWSSDSKKIAFLRFDESEVKQYNMQLWQGNLYPTDYTFKYPKAGEKNANVSVLVYDLLTQKTDTIYNGTNKNSYVPRLKWTNIPTILSVTHLNRNQDSLCLKYYNTVDYISEIALFQTNKTYIEVDDNLKLLSNSNQIIYKSHTGFRNIMITDLKTKKSNQVISFANQEIQEILAIDEVKKRIYFTAKDFPPLNKFVYSIDYDGKNLKKIITTLGVNNAEISPTFDYMLVLNSTIDNGVSYALYQTNGLKIKDLESNLALKKKLKTLAFSKLEFSSFNVKDSTSNKTYNLNYYLIKPPEFDATKKYPVLMYFYGGPGSQEVINEWQGKNYLWFQYLAQSGFVVACSDNRGTGGQGTDFKDITTGILGEKEVKDQIAFGKFLQSQSFVDKSNIATFGWSFGGYLSSLCILLGADVFHSAIAVAPVTSWRFYDTIYTERYLKNPTDNAKGYDAYSPLNHANKLKGKYLLVHGTGDDNVHFQNTIEMQRALQNAGKQFESVFYPDKSHGIGGAKTRLHLYTKMTNFLLEMKK